MAAKRGVKSGRRPFGTRTVKTASVIADKRRRRGKRGDWLRRQPRTKTEKGGKNNGRAPTYSDKPAWGKGGLVKVAPWK